MTFRRLAVSLVAVCGIFACSDDASVISLNLAADADVPMEDQLRVDQLHVTITQQSHKFIYDFAPPTKGDAGPSIQDAFFHRITLPDEFDDEDALVHVEALQAGAVPFMPPLAGQTTVHIEDDGAVAAFIKLAFPPPPPSTGGDAGAGGMTGDEESSDAAGAGGAGQ